jgi:hypothetical protein
MCEQDLAHQFKKIYQFFVHIGGLSSGTYLRPSNSYICTLSCPQAA